jgi:hypothetical protein
MNGPTPGGKDINFLRICPVEYKYNGQKGEETASAEVYFQKGWRGAVRHSAMQYMFDEGREVCHTSDKLKDKNENRLIPDGFHPLGACGKNGNSCIIYQVFGGLGQEGLISVHAEPVANIEHKTAKLPVKVQNVQMAFENRNAMSFDGKPIQDFRERFLSGYVPIEVIVTKCKPYQLGFVIQSLLGVEKIGRGYNAGYGKVELQEFQLLQRNISRKSEWKDNKFQVIEEITEVSLKDEVEEALQAWNDYLAAQ